MKNRKYTKTVAFMSALIILTVVFVACVSAAADVGGRWTVLVARLDYDLIAQMHHALDAEGIRTQIIDEGRSLRVDSRRVDEARVVIELEGAAPHDENFTWYGALEIGMAGAAYEEERHLHFIRETEALIENQLAARDGISSARVGLAIPAIRPLERDAPLPTATVVIHTTQDFTQQQGRDLALTVARHVNGLDIENIIIINQLAGTIWNGGDDVADGTLYEMVE